MIEINNLTNYSIDKGLLKRIAKEVLSKEVSKKKDLSIAIVGPKEIKQLNMKYRGENQATDVLSFGQGANIEVPKEASFLGEVVICPHEVEKNAKKISWMFEKELALCMIHGILHLLGYEHNANEKAAKKMKEKQDYYLSSFV